MAELFYEITQAEADLIGRFEVDGCSAVDPYCGKQVNGNWIIKKSTVEGCAKRAEIKAVDFTGKITKTVGQLDFAPETE